MTRPGGRLVPASGALLGAWSNPDPADWWTGQEVLDREALIGRRYRMDSHLAWYSNTGPALGVTTQLKWDIPYNRIPALTFDGPVRPFPGLKAIAAGHYDTATRNWAATIKAVGAPVFFRPWWEMNGTSSWWPWAGDPAYYAKAWRHMHNIFVAQGATNAVWVWCPNVHDAGGAPHWTLYYPGDAYVDWVGIDGYNWGSTTYSWGQSHWQSFAQVFGGTPSIYGDYAARKPIMIAEFNSVEAGGDKGQWWRDIPPVLKQSYPAIAALMVFDAVDPNIPADLRIDTSTGSLAGFIAMANDPYLAA